MNKKIIIGLIIVLLAFVSINSVMAYSSEGIVNESSYQASDVQDLMEESLSSSNCQIDLASNSDVGDLSLNLATDDNPLNETNSSKLNTSIVADDKVIIYEKGTYFNLSLVDEEGNALSNQKVSLTFITPYRTLVYNRTTDENGFAHLQINLYDGNFTIISMYLGNDLYNAASKTTSLIVQTAIYIPENLSNTEIQSIIDNAEEGKTVVFTGSRYYDLNLVINNSLNIVSNAGTLITSSLNKPVFSISTSKSAGTQISGFIINCTGKANGISIKDTSNITIKNNTICTNSIGVFAEKITNLEIKNNKFSNNPTAISFALANYTYVYGNQITGGKYGISLSKSQTSAIDKNTITKADIAAIYASDTINNVYYGEGPEKLYIRYNTLKENFDAIVLDNAGKNIVIYSNNITNNRHDGIQANKVGNNLTISRNTISKNANNGIQLDVVGSNTIQSNTIEQNQIGINFGAKYTEPAKQDISYNVVYKNTRREIEASDNENYDDGANKLVIGDNWYGGTRNLCPKLSSGYITFKTKQISAYDFEITFYDSKGNVASLLPGRTVVHTVGNGIPSSTDITNGQGLVDRDASDGDNIYFTVDGDTKSLKYKGEDPSYTEANRETYGGDLKPFEYLGMPWSEIMEKLNNNCSNGNSNGSNSGNNNGNSNGNTNGNGNGGSNSGDNGNGTTGGFNGDNGNGISTSSSNSLSSSSSSSGTGVSSASGAASSNPSDSTILKSLELDEETFRVAGVGGLLLLIILVIGLYYREDIEEMLKEEYQI